MNQPLLWRHPHGLDDLRERGDKLRQRGEKQGEFGRFHLYLLARTALLLLSGAPRVFALNERGPLTFGIVCQRRRREEERRQAIDRAKAEGTPEGNLKANELAIEQLQDAGAHGADRSPDYKPDLDRLQRTQTALKRAILHKEPQAPTQQAAAQAPENPDPLQSVGAKAPTAKGAAAVLLAAGISQPRTDNVGHGVNDRSGQSNSPVRGG